MEAEHNKTRMIYIKHRESGFLTNRLQVLLYMIFLVHKNIVLFVFEVNCASMVQSHSGCKRTGSSDYENIAKISKKMEDHTKYKHLEGIQEDNESENLADGSGYSYEITLSVDDIYYLPNYNREMVEEFKKSFESLIDISSISQEMKIICIQDAYKKLKGQDKLSFFIENCLYYHKLIIKQLFDYQNTINYINTCFQEFVEQKGENFLTESSNDSARIEIITSRIVKYQLRKKEIKVHIDSILNKILDKFDIFDKYDFQILYIDRLKSLYDVNILMIFYVFYSDNLKIDECVCKIFDMLMDKAFRMKWRLRNKIDGSTYTTIGGFTKAYSINFPIYNQCQKVQNSRTKNMKIIYDYYFGLFQFICICKDTNLVVVEPMNILLMGDLNYMHAVESLELVNQEPYQQ